MRVNVGGVLLVARPLCIGGGWTPRNCILAGYLVDARLCYVSRSDR